MKLEAVQAVNFMSHRDTVLEFDQPKMQIAGVNGSGKTSCAVDAPLWALFGHARSSTTDGLMGPWGKSMRVAVTFEASANRYRVVRERGSKSELRLENLTDATDLTEKHIAMTQEKIEKLVGSESAFVNTVVFKQGDALRFAQATPSERKSLFDELLGIEAFAEVEKRANGKIRSLKVEEDRYASELARLVEGEAKVSLVEDELKGVREISTDADAKVSELETAMLAAQGVVDGLGADHAKKGEYEKDAREAEIAYVRSQSLVNDTRRELDAKELELASLRAGTCPVCGQPTVVSDADFDRYSSEIKLLEDQHREARFLSVKLDEGLAAAKTLVTSVDTEIERRHEDALKARSIVRGELAIWTTKARDARDAVTRLEGQLAVLKVDTSKTDAVRTELGNVRRRMSGFGVIAEAFSKRGIPRELTRGFAVEVDKAANALLIGLSDMTVRISLDREGKEKGGIVEGTVDVLVTDVAGERKVEMLSGGEKMRVMLAIRLAIQQVMAKRSDKALRTLILDESLDGLDTAGKDAALTMLTGMTGSFDRMLFITHDPSVAGMFPARTELAKLTDGSSAVVV